jgi:glycosyltransferase involved in cell wall biosynthesis
MGEVVGEGGSEAPGDRRCRVLVVVGSLDVGGVEMDILRNMPALDRARFDVRVYAFEKPGKLAPDLRARGIQLVCPNPDPETAPKGAATSQPGPWRRRARDFVLRTPALRLLAHLVSNAIYLARAVAPLLRYVLRERIDVVHCFLPNAYVVGGIAALLAPGRRLVMSRVGRNHYQHQLRFYRIVERRLLHRFVDAALCNADAIRADLEHEGMQPDRIRIVRNGIEVEQYAPCSARRAAARRALGLGPEMLVLGVVANLHPYKGHADLIHGLHTASNMLPPDWRLLCIGRDTEAGQRAVLDDLVAELGLERHVTFLGQRDDVPDLLAAMDALVLPSHEEGLPNSILEAMASALPVVATRVGGVPELLVDGEGGRIVPSHDPSALGEAIADVARCAETRRAMGERNLARARAHFALAQSVQKYEALYADLCGAAA